MEEVISKMNTMAEITLEIILYDNPIPPKEISKRIGVVATEALLKGERNEKLILPRGDLWLLSSKGGDDVEEEWNYLKSKLGESWHKFTEIAKLSDEARIAIVVRIMERMPPVYIPASMVKDAAEMGANIDVPYYNYSEDDEI